MGLNHDTPPCVCWTQSTVSINALGEVVLNYGNLFLTAIDKRKKNPKVQALAYSFKAIGCWNTEAKPEGFFPSEIIKSR